MRKFLLAAVSAGVLTFAACGEEPYDFVNPFIGCAFNGHCYAAAVRPFGLVAAGPDTGNTWWNYCSGYRYADARILGFTQTHLSGMGCGDLGDFLVMPFTGDFDPARTNYTSVYRKETQVARPGYYAVTLDDNHARVETTVSQRAAIYRIAYAGDAMPRLFVDLQYGIQNWDPKGLEKRVRACEVKRLDARTFAVRLKTYIWVERDFSFTVEFDHDVTDIRRLPPRLPTEKGPRSVLAFDLKPGETLMMKLAFSTVSPEGARANLAAEIPGWDFDGVRAAATAQWNEVLGTAELVGGTRAQKENWYTSLYHLFIQPMDLTDVDGSYRGADDKVAKMPGGYYSTLSLWDTFRAANPLYTILIPERVDAMVATMLEHWKRVGFLPMIAVWGKETQCMIGTHSVPVIVDAYLKGFRGFDVDLAMRAIEDTLRKPHPNRHWEKWDVLDRYGYFPFDVARGETVSRTLEAAYDDACAARLAERLGRSESAAFFRNRSYNWTNVLDRSVGFMRGRDSKGNWREPFDPRRVGVGAQGGRNDFTEGNSYQYTWHVMQHPNEFIAAMGGRETFLKKLNGLFNEPPVIVGKALDVTGLVGQYAHGNEPGHHTAYFFPFAGAPRRTAEIVREVCDRYYRNEPEGLCGNDDCGQMSAWYLFSAMGFYPFDPCGGDYVLGAPQVPKVVLKVKSPSQESKKTSRSMKLKSKSGVCLSSQKGSDHLSSPSTLAFDFYNTFTILAKNLSKENKYVKAVMLNGKPLKGFILRHADIMAGGELVFEMGQ